MPTTDQDPLVAPAADPESDAPKPRRKRKGSPAAKLLLEQLRRDPPGQPTDNRLEQSNHYRGVIYVAIRALRDAISACTVQVTRKRKGQSYAGTAAARMVRKALPTPYAHASDELYEPVVDAGHSLVKLLDKPNASETVQDLLGHLLIQYHLTGQGLLWANPDGLGLPSELYCLPTALCWPQPVTHEYPGGAWRVTQYYPSGGMGVLPSPVSGGGALVDGRDVFQFKNPHPLWRWDGYSPLTAGSVQLDILESIDQARWTAMEQGLTPDAILLMPGADENQINAVLEQIRQANAGKRNHRKVMGVGGGADDSKFDVKFPNIAARDMDFSSGWEQMVGFALALFGVPKAVAGLVSANSYAELYASLKQFHTLVLRPLCARLGAFLTRSLAHIWDDDLSVQIDLPTIQDPEQFEKQLEADLAHDGITYNEYRALRNRPPVEGGDVLASLYVEVKKAEAQFDMQMKQQKVQQAMGLGQPGQPGQPGAPGQPPAGAQPTTDALTALLGGGGEDSGDDPLTSLLSGGTEGEMTRGGERPRPPEPRNPDAAGSLAPKINKALASLGEAPPAHKFACAHVLLAPSLREQLLALGRLVPDRHLAPDGRETDPHVTALYGLADDDPGAVADLVAGFGPVHYRLGRCGCFEGAEYDVVYAAVDSPDLHHLNRVLRSLPHESKYPTYVPHATVAYVKPGLGRHYAGLLGGLAGGGVAAHLVFAPRSGAKVLLPLLERHQKAMSTLDATAGGALVPDAAPVRRVIPVKRPGVIRKRVRRMRRVCKALLEAGDE